MGNLHEDLIKQVFYEVKQVFYEVFRFRFCDLMKRLLGDNFHRSVKYKLPVAMHSPSTSAAAAAKSLQSFPTLCDPTDGSPRGSPTPGILQARTLEWVAISFSIYLYKD